MCKLPASATKARTSSRTTTVPSHHAQGSNTLLGVGAANLRANLQSHTLAAFSDPFIFLYTLLHSQKGWASDRLQFLHFETLSYDWLGKGCNKLSRAPLGHHFRRAKISRITIELLLMWVHAIHAYTQGPALGQCHTCKFDATCHLRMRNLLPQCHRSQKVNQHLLRLFHFFGPNLSLLDPRLDSLEST